MKYAILEWKQDGDDDDANVMATNQDISTAELLVKITPSHLHREIITMDELSEKKSRS